MTFATILAAAAVLTAGPGRVDLAGRVTSGDSPVAGASVIVYAAGVRQGTSPYNPSAHNDCGKRATTDGDGRYRIESLDPSLLFRILAVADGLEPQFEGKVDPAAGPLAIALKVYPPDRLDADRTIRGHVVGPDGAPVVGATLYPHGIHNPGGGITWGRVDEVDPVAITGLDGGFRFSASRPGVVLELQAGARGLATRMFADVKAGDFGRQLRLDVGATLAGRVMRGGEPVRGRPVGLAHANRAAGRFLGTDTIGTDDDGRFVFPNLNPDDDYYLYGVMDGFKDLGATPIKSAKTGGDGTRVDVGTLEVEAGLKLSGRVVVDDGGSLPPGTRIRTAGYQAWDSQAAVIDAEGRFALAGLRPGTIELVLRPKGFHLSEKNLGYNLLNPGLVAGHLAADTDGVTILLEPGPAPDLFETINAPDFQEKQNRLQGRPRGKVVVGVAPGAAR